MNPYEKQTCITLSQKTMFRKIKSLLGERYSTIRLDSVNSALTLIRCYPLTCIIAYIDGEKQTTPEKLKTLINLFPTIPIIAVLKKNDLEIARRCGKIGLDYVIEENKLELLPDIIHFIIRYKNPKVSWTEFGIDITQCPVLVKNALDILEEQYVKLKNIQEVSDSLNVSPETLSRTFKKCLPIGPKQIWTLIQIHRAIHLMKNPGLNIQEIAGLTGFSDKYQFSKRFRKIVDISPSQYRQNKDKINSRELWQRIIRNIKK